MMKQHKHIWTIIRGMLLVAGALVLTTITQPVAAAPRAVPLDDGGGSSKPLDCNILPDSICSKAEVSSTNAEDTAVWALLLLLINIMTAGAGLLAIGGIIYGSVLYTTAGSSQEQIKKARSMFVNVAIGVIAFALMYAFLQWLIPGGVF